MKFCKAARAAPTFDDYRKPVAVKRASAEAQLATDLDFSPFGDVSSREGLWGRNNRPLLDITLL
jgi:hypothetical protein